MLQLGIVIQLPYDKSSIHYVKTSPIFSLLNYRRRNRVSVYTVCFILTCQKFRRTGHLYDSYDTYYMLKLLSCLVSFGPHNLLKFVRRRFRDKSQNFFAYLYYINHTNVISNMLYPYRDRMGPRR